MNEAKDYFSEIEWAYIKIGERLLKKAKLEKNTTFSVIPHDYMMEVNAFE